MTGKEIVEKWRKECPCTWEEVPLIDAIDAALAAETARCAQIVWENRGKCMNDELARALMAEVRRVR
jgi:hypothetical protein